MNDRIIIVSGYFNPLHRGHIEYIDAANALFWARCTLIAIVNNDLQVGLKGGVPYIDEDERAFIVKNLKRIDEVIISKDRDLTVSETLKHIVCQCGAKPDYHFINSGDREPSTYPKSEVAVCETFGITQHFIELPKVNNSSDIREKMANRGV